MEPRFFSPDVSLSNIPKENRKKLYNVKLAGKILRLCTKLAQVKILSISVLGKRKISYFVTY